MPSRVVLDVVSGPLKGHRFAFEEHDTLVFGRSDDCKAQLSSADETASRHHFLLEVNPPEASLRDLGSLNGTFVNDKKYGGRRADQTPEEAARKQLENVAIGHGDRIQVGQSEFHVEVHEAPQCSGCGIEIPESFRSLARHNGGYLCGVCRENREKSDESGGPRCLQCGREVAREVGQRRGDYVCSNCRTEIDDPAAMLRAILENRARQEGGVPQELAGYRVGEKLGEGGMGAVYRATDRQGHEAAVKVMLPRVAVNERSRALFLRECTVTSQLQHRHIVRLLDYGAHGPTFYCAIELCAGGCLQSLMKQRGGRLPLAEVDRWLLEALDGLGHAHVAQIEVELADGSLARANGIVHRDLKPANILLSQESGRLEVKISDFGLSKAFDAAGLSGHTVTGSTAGTLSFMPREQLTNFKKVKPSTDIWSMGATFYNLLTGQLPRDFPAGVDPALAILQNPVVPIRRRERSIPRRVAEVIDHSLRDNVRERFQTCAEFRSELASALG